AAAHTTPRGPMPVHWRAMTTSGRGAPVGPRRSCAPSWTGAPPTVCLSGEFTEIPLRPTDLVYKIPYTRTVVATSFPKGSHEHGRPPRPRRLPVRSGRRHQGP